MCIKDYKPIIDDNLENIEIWRAEGKTVDEVCKKLRIKKGAMYYWMHKDRAIKDAMDYLNTWILNEEVEPTLRRLAVGYEKIDQILKYSPKTKRMEVVEERRTTMIDSKVTMFLAKALDPKKYGDKQQIEINQMELDESLESLLASKKEEEDNE